MKANGLPADRRLWIIKALAGFMTPQEAADAYEAEFGDPISRKTVAYYDPHHSPKLAKKWRDLFEEERTRYLEDMADIAIAHESFRLRRLEYLHRLAMKAGEREEAAGYLAQAAKERGGQFTNARRFTDAQGRDAPMLPVYPVVVGPGAKPPADFVDPTKGESS